MKTVFIIKTILYLFNAISLDHSLFFWGGGGGGGGLKLNLTINKLEIRKILQKNVSQSLITTNKDSFVNIFYCIFYLLHLL